MIARVGRIDRDERQVAPVLAMRHVGGCGGLRRLDHGARKDVRDAVLFERDQADGLLARDVAEPLDDAPGRQGRAGRLSSPRRRPARRRARPSRRRAIRQARSRGGRRARCAPRRRAARKMPSEARGGAPSTRMTRAVKPPVSRLRRQPREHAVADARRALPSAFAAPAAMTMRGASPHSSSHSTGTPIGSPSSSMPSTASTVTEGRSPGRCRCLRAAFDQPFVGELAQHALQRDLLPAGEPEGARDVALARLAGALGDEFEDRLAGRKLGFRFLFGPLRQFGPIRPPPWPWRAASWRAPCAPSSAALLRRRAAGFLGEKLHRLLQRHVLRLHVPGKRGVHLAMIHVRPVAPRAHGDRAALRRMLAEAPSARRCVRARARSSSRQAARSRGWRRR